jgi:glutamate racemase
MKTMNDKPIGIFDSGVGGLTVTKAIIDLLPNENIVYFGDTARVPYGNKSKETIIKYSIQNTKFLLQFKIKLLVVACNTSSSYAIPTLKKMFKNLKIIEVVTPGARAAVEYTKNYKIGIIGTKATIKSMSYVKAIKKICKKAKVYCQPTPLFVPLIEEGWVDKIRSVNNDFYQTVNHENILRQLSVEYLAPLKKYGIDVLVLGCTHYPAIKNIIQDIIGEEVTIVDSSVETAKEVKSVIEQNGLKKISTTKPEYQFFVSDDPVSFKKIGSLLLEREIKYVKKVRVE